VRRRFVRLVDNKNVTEFHCLHERRIFVDHFAIPNVRLQRQGLHGCIPMQLYVLARPVQQLQQPIDDLVLADALISDQQKILPQAEVLQQPLQQRYMFRYIVEQNVRHFGECCIGTIPIHDSVADPHSIVRDRAFDLRVLVHVTPRDDVHSTAAILESLPRDRWQKSCQTGALNRIVCVVAAESMHPLGDSQDLSSAEGTSERLQRWIIGRA